MEKTLDLVDQFAANERTPRCRRRQPDDYGDDEADDNRVAREAQIPGDAIHEQVITTILREDPMPGLETHIGYSDHLRRR